MEVPVLRYEPQHGPGGVHEEGQGGGAHPQLLVILVTTIFQEDLSAPSDETFEHLLGQIRSDFCVPDLTNLLFQSLFGGGHWMPENMIFHDAPYREIQY